MWKATTQVYFQRFVTKWALRRPATAALGAFVQDNFRGWQNMTVFTKIKNHVT